MLLGLDLGTQSLKAVLIDRGWRLCGQGDAALAIRHPVTGAAEQSPEDWLAALRPAIAAALQAADVPPGQVEAVAVAGQLDGCVVVDGQARPLGPALIWMDRRAGQGLAGIDPELIRRRTGLVADPSHLAAKIRWRQMAGRVPEGARFHQPVSFLVERLAGVAVQDHALASTSMLYALATRDYDPVLCELFDISRDSLPRLADAADIAGGLTADGAALTGLPRGIPVCVGTGDDFASAIGAGVTEPGTVLCCVGTAEVVGAVHDRPALDPGALVETHGFPGGRFFIENPGWLSGGAMRWLRDLLGVADWAALERAATAVPAGADGVTILPTLAGAMAPEWLAEARGAAYGLTPAHGPGHLARAVMEGAAFAMADVIDRLAALGVATARIRYVGGGARSALWARIRATVANRPVDLVDAEHAAALGAAALAAVATGRAASIAEAGGRLARVASTILPEPGEAAALADARGRAQALFGALRPLMLQPWAKA